MEGMRLRTRGSYTLLDANVIVALLDRKDNLHREAVERIREIEGKTTFAVLSPILSESYSVIARRCRERKYDCKEAVSALQELESRLEVFHPHFEDYHLRVVSLLKENPELNYNDWLLYLFSRDNLLGVVTLDRKLEKVIERGEQSYDRELKG